MKENGFPAKRIALAVALFLFAIVVSPANNFPVSVEVKHVVTRGVEIRYIVINELKEREKKEVEVDGKKYSLYKTKEDAIDAVAKAFPKRDLTVVYVLSDTEKEKEIVEIAD